MNKLITTNQILELLNKNGFSSIVKEIKNSSFTLNVLD
jgi:hypothetical protein